MILSASLRKIFHYHGCSPHMRFASTRVKDAVLSTTQSNTPVKGILTGRGHVRIKFSRVNIALLWQPQLIRKGSPTKWRRTESSAVQ